MICCNIWSCVVWCNDVLNTEKHGVRGQQKKPGHTAIYLENTEKHGVRGQQKKKLLLLLLLQLLNRSAQCAGQYLLHDVRDSRTRSTRPAQRARYYDLQDVQDPRQYPPDLHSVRGIMISTTCEELWSAGRARCNDPPEPSSNRKKATAGIPRIWTKDRSMSLQEWLRLMSRYISSLFLKLSTKFEIIWLGFPYDLNGLQYTTRERVRHHDGVYVFPLLYMTLASLPSPQSCVTCLRNYGVVYIQTNYNYDW